MRHRHWPISLFVSCVASVVGPSAAFSQSDDQNDSARSSSKPVAAEKANLHRLLDEAAGQYSMYADPEALLMLETVPTKPGEKDYEWQFAFGRRTSGKLEARYGDQVVWNAEKNPEWRDSTRTYFQLSHRLPDNALTPPSKQD